jgi:glycosyltransferase involved in cell wall biosynthesis
MKPLVSGLMATYNGEAFVADAVESMLAQSYSDVEIVVCDDGSSDGTRDVLRSFGDKIRLIEQPNAGVSAARNHAASVAQGALLAFLDQDDRWEPDLLTVQVGALAANSDWGCVYAESLVIDDQDRVHDRRGRYLEYASGWVFDKLLDGNFIPLETLVMRAELFRDLGGFDEKLRLLEDFELCLRAAKAAPVGFVDNVLGRYRIHDTNLSHDMDGIVSEYAVVLEQLLGGGHDLSAPEREHVVAALRNRWAEQAWHALRRADLDAADGYWGRVDGPCRRSLALKIRLLRALLGVLPPAAGRALVQRLPRRRLYGR